MRTDIIIHTTSSTKCALAWYMIANAWPRLIADIRFELSSDCNLIPSQYWSHQHWQCRADIENSVSNNDSCDMIRVDRKVSAERYVRNSQVSSRQVRGASSYFPRITRRYFIVLPLFSGTFLSQCACTHSCDVTNANVTNTARRTWFRRETRKRVVQ